MDNAARGEMQFQAARVNILDQPADHDAILRELRQDLDRAAAQWASVIGESAARSIRAANKTVQQRPWTSVALAAVVGAIVACALVSPRRVKHPIRADIDREQRILAIQRAPRATTDTQPLSSRLVQAWDSIANLNANALPTLSPSAVPSFETLAGLAKSLWTTPSQAKSAS